MKTIIALLLTLPLAINNTPTCSYDDPETYRAYLNPEGADQIWIERVKTLEATYATTKSKSDLYTLTLTEFGLLSSTMRTSNQNLFDKYVDITETHLNQLAKDSKYAGEANALLSAIYGFKMGYSPWKGMFLGPKSSSLMEKAVKADPQSPLVWKLYGNSKYYTPASFGGNIDEAIKGYTKSIELYEQQGCEHNWFVLDTYAFLGQAYRKNNEKAKAITTYEKVLEIEPDFHWVKNNLLPTAKK